MDHTYTYSIQYLDYHWSGSGIHMDLFVCVDDEWLAWLEHYGTPCVLHGYDK